MLKAEIGDKSDLKSAFFILFLLFLVFIETLIELFEEELEFLFKISSITSSIFFDFLVIFLGV